MKRHGLIRRARTARIAAQTRAVARGKTLAAQQGDLSIVVHLSKGTAISTSQAGVLAAPTAARDVAVKATLPGLSGPTGLEAMRSLRQGGAQSNVATAQKRTTG
jgi:NADPH-dependent 2,4-dienoyl-CoA reductase/sulfur reductase-like enzyme